MLFPTSTSAMSMDRIDLPPKAVPPRVLVQAPPFGWGVVQEAEVG